MPHLILEAHEVQPGDEFDKDWTLNEDQVEERRLREVRNELIREHLAKGKTVSFRQSGWSLWPRVCSNDSCTYIPVRFEGQVLEGDIVFCIVQPSGYDYAHLVKEKEYDRSRREYKFWISNLKGRSNGFCYIEHIFGKHVQALL